MRDNTSKGPPSRWLAVSPSPCPSFRSSNLIIDISSFSSSWCSQIGCQQRGCSRDWDNMSSQARTANLYYAKDSPNFQHEKPFMILTAFCEQPEKSETNVEFESPEPETISDIRGREDQFSLDRQGFEFITHKTQFEDWRNRRSVEEQYLPEVVNLIEKHVEGADEVQIFDWRVSSVHLDSAPWLPDIWYIQMSVYS